MAGWEGIDEIVAIAECGTFSAAAVRLGTSTSHMSRAVARLEQRIGAPIFSRTTRRVVPTPSGRILIEQFRRLIGERDDALLTVSDQGTPRGEVRLTCSVTIGERFVAGIAREFATKYPEVTVDIELTNRIVDLVAEGFDLAIRTGTLSDSRMVATKIASRDYSVCASPAYLAPRERPRCIADLDRHECLIGTSSTWHFSVEGVERLYRPCGRWRCNSGNAVLKATIDGHGICQLPSFYVNSYVHRGTLVPLLEELRPASEPIWAVYPQRRHLVPQVRLLVELLRQDLPKALQSETFAD